MNNTLANELGNHTTRNISVGGPGTKHSGGGGGGGWWLLCAVWYNYLIIMICETAHRIISTSFLSDE